MDTSTLHDQNFMPSFLKHFHLCTYKGLKFVFLSNNLMWIYKSNYVNIGCVKKWNGGCALNNVLNPYNVFNSCIVSTLKTTKKKQWKIVKNNGNNERDNLRPQFTSWFSKPWAFLLASFFYLDQLNFPPKWCHVKCHLRLAWIDLICSSKGVRSNL
jgi:hypothetical protein